jgi:hypothetical protein
MNKLSTEKRARVVAALVEGNSINSTARMTGVSKPTILRLIADLGAACERFHDETVRGVKARRVQCDEIWAFCYSKQKNVPADKKGVFGYGDVWTWTALDADSKLMVSWLVGARDAGCAHEFMQDVASRLDSRVQLTTDGHKVYLDAVWDAFADEIDYAMLQKIYGSDPQGEKRYSPAVCIGAKAEPVCGSPDPKHISTSYVDDPHVHAALYAADERALQKGRESSARGFPVLRVLQLRPRACDAEGHARDGGGAVGSRLVGRGNHRVT